jgi:uncharacterized protein
MLSTHGSSRVRMGRVIMSNIGDDRTRDLTAFLVKAIVENPDEVSVSHGERRGEPVLQINVAGRDRGTVIGRQGRTIRAIETILDAASGGQGIPGLDISTDE